MGRAYFLTTEDSLPKCFQGNVAEATLPSAACYQVIVWIFREFNMEAFNPNSWRGGACPAPPLALSQWRGIIHMYSLVTAQHLLEIFPPLGSVHLSHYRDTFPL